MKEPLASRVLFPLVERRFTYAEYERFLDGLPREEVVPLREFACGEGRVGLRHDVDDRLESALTLARLEAARGLCTTYFVLHTAPYWRRDGLVERLLELQSLGHEVGFHNDLVTLERVHGVDAAAWVRAELARLRDAGVDVVGAAAHGSPWCHRLGFHNNYAFAGWDDPVPGFPNRDGPPKLDPAELGLEYEAYHLGEHDYFSDSRFERGRRAHPADFGLDPAKRTIFLVHPDHWDAGLGAKVARLGARVAAKLRR